MKCKISLSIDAQRFDGQEQPEAYMCGECNMFDVTLALESCMICGSLSCGSVRSKRGIVVLIARQYRDN